MYNLISRVNISGEIVGNPFPILLRRSIYIAALKRVARISNDMPRRSAMSESECFYVVFRVVYEFNMKGNVSFYILLHIIKIALNACTDFFCFTTLVYLLLRTGIFLE